MRVLSVLVILFELMQGAPILQNDSGRGSDVHRLDKPQDVHRVLELILDQDEAAKHTASVAAAHEQYDGMDEDGIKQLPAETARSFSLDEFTALSAKQKDWMIEHHGEKILEELEAMAEADFRAHKARRAAASAERLRAWLPEVVVTGRGREGKKKNKKNKKNKGDLLTPCEQDEYSSDFLE